MISAGWPGGRQESTAQPGTPILRKPIKTTYKQQVLSSLVRPNDGVNNLWKEQSDAFWLTTFAIRYRVSPLLVIIG